MSARLVQISDPHLSADDPSTVANLEQALIAVRADPPDAVIVTGDIVSFDPDTEADHHLATQRFATTNTPTYSLPGNHDIGEAGIVPWGGPLVTSERLERFVRVWGADRWSFTLGPWLVLGLNALLEPETLSAETAAQSEEMHVALSTHDGPVAVFTHKPFVLHGGTSPQVNGYTADHRPILLPFAEQIQFVSSGHLHRGVVVAPTRDHPWTRVWCPSTQFAGSDDWGCGAVPRRGWAEFTLHDDGSFTPHLIWADA